MLGLSLSEIYDQIRDFSVAEGPRHALLGVAALHVIWDDLAEVRSLAVDPKSRRRGLGRSLVEHCLEEARRLEIPKVFALTYRRVFRRIGFERVDKAELPPSSGATVASKFRVRRDGGPGSSRPDVGGAPCGEARAPCPLARLSAGGATAAHCHARGVTAALCDDDFSTRPAQDRLGESSSPRKYPRRPPRFWKAKAGAALGRRSRERPDHATDLYQARAGRDDPRVAAEVARKTTSSRRARAGGYRPAAHPARV
jgi:N-acetylglutamate synthase-like GNAT family acetyltransferase